MIKEIELARCSGTDLKNSLFSFTVGAPGISCRKDAPLHCPFCHHEDSRVVDSRTSEDGSTIRRRRECPNCGGRFSTIETTLLLVKKRSGVTEQFSRDKVIAGMAKATQGRPVTEAQLALLAQGVEETLRQKGAAIINSEEIGKAILEPLKALDEVAYLRFASVYSDFNTLEDFEKAIKSLKNRS